MTIVLWIVAVVMLAAYGSFAGRLRVVDGIHRPAQAAILLATGTVACGVIMFLESVVHLRWNRVTLLVPLIAVAMSLRVPSSVRTPVRRWAWLAVLVLLFIYAVVTGRATSPDLLYFWGPKGVHFFRAGRIDTGFLSAPEHFLMHADYPPLLPLVYAFASCVAKGFSWWGTILTTVLYYIATIMAFNGLAARAVGDTRAAAYTALLAAILAFGYVHTGTAGNAEPLLILFEVITLSLLTFADDIPGSGFLASVALLGLVLTKVEGAMFAAAVVVAYAVSRRSLVRVIQLAAPSTLGLAAWILFAKHFGLLDSYRPKPIVLAQSASVFTAMLTKASYRAAYLPWIACTAPILFGRDWKRSALPLLVALLFSAGLFFVYLHSPDARGWINTSAERVFLSSQVALAIAATSMSPIRTTTSIEPILA
jgi:hypothetical protein